MNKIKRPFIAMKNTLSGWKLEYKYQGKRILLLIILLHWILGYAFITGSTFYEDYTAQPVKASGETRREQSESVTTNIEIGGELWIREQWEEAGADWNEVWAVVQAESGWNSDAWNCNNNGSLDLGLYQGNSIHKDLTPSCALSTICSTNWSIALWKEQGFTPWVAAKKLGIQ